MNKIADIVTEKIIENIKATGRLPWSKPWKTFRFNGKDVAGAWNLTGYSYRGINELLLSMLPYDVPCYVTFNQAKKLGGTVTKGEKGHMVVFWMIGKEQPWLNPKTGITERKKPFMLRYTTVFNIAQTEGLDKHLPKIDGVDAPDAPEFERIELAEAIINGMPNAPTITYAKQDRAFYRPSTDSITLPLREQFHTSAGFYSTAFHEMAHSTGHTSRLNRKEIGGTSFGDEAYSKEELTAELSASILAGQCGFFEEIEQNASAYIQGWLTALKNDPSMIISACSRAKKAVAYIVGDAPEVEPEAVEA